MMDIVDDLPTIDGASRALAATIQVDLPVVDYGILADR
jgi:hypothetical protein